METESLIAQNVRLRMHAMNLNYKTLSLKAGLNETYVRDLIKGRSSNPRQAHLQRLAHALECLVSDLTGEQQPIPYGSIRMDAARQELIAAFEAADEQGRAMLLRMAACLHNSA